MKPYDILNQILDTPPDDDNINWNGDVIEVLNVRFRRHHYSQVSLNLSQGIVYFYIDRTVVLKLAIEVQLKTITEATPETNEETEENE